MRDVGVDRDGIVGLCSSNVDAAGGHATFVGVGDHKGVVASGQSTHFDVVSSLVDFNGIAIVLPVLDGLDAVGRLAASHRQDGISRRGLGTNSGVVAELVDRCGDGGVQAHIDGLRGVQTVDVTGRVLGDELNVLTPKLYAVCIGSSPSGTVKGPCAVALGVGQLVMADIDSGVGKDLGGDKCGRKQHCTRRSIITTNRN